MKKLATSLVVATLATTAFAKPTQPKADYPSKPITVIAGFGIGGNADASARLMAQFAPPYVGTPIVVFNRTGKNGVTGTMAVKNAAADGYTLLLARSSSNLVEPINNPTGTPYSVDDFTVLGILELNGWGCAVANKPSEPQDYNAMKVAMQQGANFSYSGAAALHFSKMFSEASGAAPDTAKAINAPSANDSVRAVLDGKAKFVCANTQALLPHARLKTIKILVTNEDKKSESATFGAKTSTELGLKDLEKLSAWSALYAPKGATQQTIEAWTNALLKLKDDQNWNGRVQMIGSVPAIKVGAEAQAFIAEQAAFYKSLKK